MDNSENNSVREVCGIYHETQIFRKEIEMTKYRSNCKSTKKKKQRK